MDSRNTTERAYKKIEDYNFVPLVVILGVLAFIFTLYIGYKVSISTEKIIFPFSLVALLAGLIYEGFRISENLKNFVFTLIITYFVSLLVFIPGIQESHFSFDFDFKTFIIFFLFIFTILIAIYNRKRVTAQLTEGITLLLSLSLIYWTIDYGLVNIANLFVQSILISALLISAFSIISALTYAKLSRTIRLSLSIWSTIVMVCFAVDNIYRVLKNEDIHSTNLTERFSIGLQFFLLGVSAVYIMQNVILLLSFFPNKNGTYKEDLKEIKKEHIKRYSDKQVNSKLSLFCILYALTIYTLNYKFQVLPRHTMIWFVFLTFPILSFLTNKKNIETNLVQV